MATKSVADILHDMYKGLTPTYEQSKALAKEIQRLNNHLKTRDKYIQRLEHELHSKTTST